MTASVPSMTNQMDYPVDSVEAPVSAVPASTTNIQQYRSRKERAEFKELLLLPNSISARHFPLLILTRLLIFMTH